MRSLLRWLCAACGHFWRDSRWCAWQFATEQRCAGCGAYRHMEFEKRNARGFGEPEWTAGRFPEPTP